MCEFHEPWHISPNYADTIENANGDEVVEFVDRLAMLGNDCRDATLERIVACVNACQGIGTADLQRYGVQLRIRSVEVSPPLVFAMRGDE